MKTLLFGILLVTLLTSCSSKKGTSSSEATDGEAIEISDTELEKEIDFELDQVAGDGSEQPGDDIASAISQDVTGSVEGTGQYESYVVQPGDTLMLIAWKTYGDYTKWRDIYNLNADQLGNGTNLTVGTSLKFEVPATVFEWNPAGEPYLILGGDTLGIISNKVYNTPKKWRKIWDNNKPLIRDPNLIFAGFTLYYLPEEEFAAAK